MRIIIDCDGDSRNTVISINGAKQKLFYFNFSIKTGGKAKIQMGRLDSETNQLIPCSFYGNDFEKFDNPNGHQSDEILGKNIVKEK